MTADNFRASNKQRSPACTESRSALALCLWADSTPRTVIMELLCLPKDSYYKTLQAACVKSVDFRDKYNRAFPDRDHDKDAAARLKGNSAPARQVAESCSVSDNSHTVEELLHLASAEWDVPMALLKTTHQGFRPEPENQARRFVVLYSLFHKIPSKVFSPALGFSTPGSYGDAREKGLTSQDTDYLTRCDNLARKLGTTHTEVVKTLLAKSVKKHTVS